MGAQLGSGGVRSRRGAKGRYQPLAEINVTPFVDVMLVLLIIFMVAAPMLAAGVKVNLPKAAAKNLAQDQKPLEITIDQNGAIFIADTAIKVGELGERLSAIAGNDTKDLMIYIRADKAVDYGRVAEVMGLVSAAGFTKMNMVMDNR